MFACVCFRKCLKEAGSGEACVRAEVFAPAVFKASRLFMEYGNILTVNTGLCATLSIEI